MPSLEVERFKGEVIAELVEVRPGVMGTREEAHALNQAREERREVIELCVIAAVTLLSITFFVGVIIYALS